MLSYNQPESVNIQADVVDTIYPTCTVYIIYGRRE